MSVAFVHLSDVHFGQERDSRVFVHNDVKDRLVDDVRRVVSNLSAGRAAGIIVTGDIAYAGKVDQYAAAAEWLDRICRAVDCEIFDVQLVPGNHDIDRDEITGGMALVLAKIAAEGDAALDTFLRNERDREELYQRFKAYRRFAEGYDCPLDCEGHPTIHRKVELAEGRSIRFVRINSALACSASDKEGHLLLGARQWALPQNDGEEVVVLAYHPLNWLSDVGEVTKYLRSRARIFISGHEHDPSVKVEEVENGCELMILAAGATVPPSATGLFTHTYNVIEFDWDSGSDALAVTIHPRAWNDARKRFEADDRRLGGGKPRFVLASPNFRGAGRSGTLVDVTGGGRVAEPTVELASVVEIVPSIEAEGEKRVGSMVEGYQLALLRFFRDLTEGDRVRILVELGAVTEDMTTMLTQATERQLFDVLVSKGMIAALAGRIEAAMGGEQE